MLSNFRALKFNFHNLKCGKNLGERQGITQKGVRAIDPRKKTQLEMANTLQTKKKTSARAPGLSADECEHLSCDTLGLAENHSFAKLQGFPSETYH